MYVQYVCLCVCWLAEGTVVIHTSRSLNNKKIILEIASVCRVHLPIGLFFHFKKKEPSREENKEEEVEEEEEELKTLFFRERRVKWRERKKKSYKKTYPNQRREGKAVERERSI